MRCSTAAPSVVKEIFAARSKFKATAKIFEIVASKHHIGNKEKATLLDGTSCKTIKQSNETRPIISIYPKVNALLHHILQNKQNIHSKLSKQ